MGQTEDVAVGIGRVVNGRNQVLKGGARVVGELLKDRLGLFFCERAHRECVGVDVSWKVVM